jgi:hypothetical protein
MEDVTVSLLRFASLQHGGFRGRLVLTALFAALSFAKSGAAQEFGYRYYGSGGADPYSYAPAPGSYPAAYTTFNYQTNPFAVGYDLLAGYRPVYGGARPINGHEMIWTSDNGYVYRPTYSPDTQSSRIAWWGGPLVIDFPGTDRAKYYTSSGPVWELKPGMFTHNDVAPPLPPLVSLEPQAVAPAAVRSGPREF